MGAAQRIAESMGEAGADRPSCLWDVGGGSYRSPGGIWSTGLGEGFLEEVRSETRSLRRSEVGEDMERKEMGKSIYKGREEQGVLIRECQGWTAPELKIG